MSKSFSKTGFSVENKNQAKHREDWSGYLDVVDACLISGLGGKLFSMRENKNPGHRGPKADCVPLLIAPICRLVFSMLSKQRCKSWQALAMEGKSFKQGFWELARGGRHSRRSTLPFAYF